MTTEQQAHSRHSKTLVAMSFLCALVLPGLAQANAFSYTGTFATDDQVQFFNVSIGSQSNVTFESFGYGGGTNASAQIISPGGFDSLFTLFDSSGNQIAGNDNGNCGVVNTYNDACLDAYMKVYLTAGSYTLALTESGNDPIFALSDGFSEQGQGDFTANGPCPAFCDVFGNQDNGQWAVDITVNSLAATPEPVTFWLMLFGLFLLAPARWRRIHARK